jgi:hypothetical protein
MNEALKEVASRYTNTVKFFLNNESSPTEKELDSIKEPEITIHISNSPRKLVPLPSRNFYSEFSKPKHLGEIYGDIIEYICSFLNEKELIVAGQVCKSWRKNSSTDELWESFNFKKHWKFKTIKEEKSNFKPNYMKNSKLNYELGHRILIGKKNLKTFEKISTTSRFLYGCAFPTLFCIGLLFMTIISILILDGTIPIRLSFLIPILSIFGVLCILTYFSVLICLFIDPCLFETLKRKYFTEAISQEIIKPKYSKKSRNQLIAGARLVVGGSFWIPLSIICFCLKGLFPLDPVPYSVCLIPIHTYTLLYAIIPPVILLLRKIQKKSFQCKKKTLFSFWVYCVMLLVNLYVSIQSLFVGLHLDEVYETKNYWSLTLIPTWLFLILICLGSCPMCCIFFWGSYTLNVLGFITMLGCSICCLTPFVFFVVPFVLRLDNVLIGSFWPIFVPCFFFECYFAISILLSNLISYRFFGFYAS